MGEGEREGRPRDLEAAGARVRRWRQAGPEVWGVVAAGLDGAQGVAADALRIFAVGGSEAAPYADRLLRFVEDHRFLPDAWMSNVDRAVQALVGVGDDRVVPWYRERFGSYYLTPGALPERWAPALLPAFRERLREGPKASGVREVLRHLTGWGPAAAPAVPELLTVLDTPYARQAAEALGRIGAGAAPAAGLLGALARGDLRPPRADAGTSRTPRRWHGAQTAAWAHWRVTGDPHLALDVIGAAVRAGHPVLTRLADLGPLAASRTDDLRPYLDHVGAWARAGAAEAWWRLTGDAATAVRTLLPQLTPLAAHEATPLILRTVEALGRIGRPAAPATPLLEAVTTSERRYGGTILLDESLHRAAEQALRRIA